MGELLFFSSSDECLHRKQTLLELRLYGSQVRVVISKERGEGWEWEEKAASPQQASPPHPLPLNVSIVMYFLL